MEMERRTFLKRACGAASAVIATIVAIPAVRYLIDPLTRSRKDGGFIRAVPLSALTSQGPTRVAIISEQQDAYTRYPPGTIGQVFLTKVADKNGKESVRCLQTICPHLGCSINYLADRQSFACPCHASDFDQEGRRRQGPAPRDMDPLDCRVSEPDAAGERWVEVKYREFVAGPANRQVKS